MSEVQEQFASVLNEAVQHAKSEGANIGSRNSIRWNKGIAANRAIELAKQLPKGTFKGSPQKFVREQMIDALAGSGIAVKVFSANELSITAGAANAWLDLRGAATSYGKDGALVVDIAVDKAYALKGIKKYEDARDALLVFADTYDELACKNLRKLANETGTAGAEVTELINAIEKQSSSTNEPVGEIIKSRLLELADLPEMVSMKIDAALHDGDWTDVRRHMGAIDQFLGYAVEDGTGFTTNTRTLERVISWFVPREYGYASLINLFVENGEMTKGQAEAFMRGIDSEEGEGDFIEGEDELVEELAALTKGMEKLDSRLQEEIDEAQQSLEVHADESEEDEDEEEFDFDDDPVFDDDDETRPWE